MKHDTNGKSPAWINGYGVGYIIGDNEGMNPFEQSDPRYQEWMYGYDAGAAACAAEEWELGC